MSKLSKHIKLAHDDVADVNISAQKISTRFQKIKQVELQAPAAQEERLISIEEQL